MPRKPRLHVPGGLFHVILRGNGRQDIFFDVDDRRRWEDLLAEGLSRYEHRIHAYCWMTNHVHMAIQCHEDPLANFMRFVASAYARSTNRKLNRSGHLFERRYRSVLVEANAYLLQLVRYIHRNPLRAGMVEDLARYRWSSHSAYVTGVAPSWLTLDWVLQMLGRSGRHARNRYVRLMASDESSSAISADSQGATDNHRTLGSDDFAFSTVRTSRPDGEAMTLMQIAQKVCLEYGLTVTDLRMPSRDKRLTRVRAEIALRAIETGVATNADVARFFRRSEAAISRATVRLRWQKQKSGS